MRQIRLAAQSGLHAERDPNESSVGLRSRRRARACYVDGDRFVVEWMARRIASSCPEPAGFSASVSAPGRDR
jgi:hypothetical protein